MCMKNVIYVLIDPDSQKIRYVGYTSNSKRRLVEHLLPSKLKAKTHKNDWIKSLLKIGLKPELICLQEYETAEELPKAEESWYKLLISRGEDLTNDPEAIGLNTPRTFGQITRGFAGKHHTEASKRKTSETLKANPPTILSIEDELIIVERYNNGINVKDIGYSYCAIYRVLKKYNVKRRGSANYSRKK